MKEHLLYYPSLDKIHEFRKVLVGEETFTEKDKNKGRKKKEIGIIQEERERGLDKGYVFDSQQVQENIVQEFKTWFSDDEIQTFCDNFYDFLLTSDTQLNKYVSERRRQILEHHPTLQTQRYLKVLARNIHTGAIKKKITPVKSYITEVSLDELIFESGTSKDKGKSEYLPSFDDDTLPEIVSTANIVGLYEPSRTIPPLEKMPYIIQSRVKRSERYLQKFVDWMLGVREIKDYARDFFFYDSSGIIEINPLKELYPSTKQIQEELSDKPKSHFDNTTFWIEYASELPKEFNKAIVTKKIIAAQKLAKEIKHRGGHNITREEKKILLMGLKIHHIYDHMRMESFMQTREMFEIYENTIGHTTIYIADRDRNRKEVLAKNGLQFVASNLEDMFRPMFRVAYFGRS